MVLVEGEAGIGKSRLVHEAAAAVAAAGRRVLTGLCHPLREPYPYGPVIDALRKAGDWLPPVADLPPSAGVLAPLLPDLAARLPAPPRPAADAHAKRFQLVTGLRSFLAALGPAVLVVEDAHWIDEATGELLLLLTRDMPEQLSLVLTYRAEDLPPGGSVLGPAYRRQPGVSGAAIHLNPLSGPDVQALAHAALGAHATVELGTVLYQRSEGLPLAAEEDLITLAERGPARAAADPPAGPAGRSGARRGAARAARGVHRAPERAVGGGADRGRGRRRPGRPGRRAAAGRGRRPGAGAGLARPHRGAARRGAAGDRHRPLLLPARPGPARRLRADARTAARPPAPARHRRPGGPVPAAAGPDRAPQPAPRRPAGLAGARRRRPRARPIALGDSGTAAALLHQILEQPGVAGDRRSRAALALGTIAVNGVDYVTDARVAAPHPGRPAAADRDPRARSGSRSGCSMVNHAGDRAGFREVARAAEELADRPDRAARAMVALAMNERDENGVRAWAWMERADAEAALCPDPAVSAAAQATRLTLLAREGDPGVWALTDQLPRTSADDEVMRQTVRALYNTGELAIELGHDRRAARMLHESRDLATRVSFPRMECYSRIALLRLDALAGDWEDVENRFTGLCSEYPDIAMAKTDEALTVGQVAAARGLRARAAELFTAAAAYGEMESQVTAGLRAAAGLIAVRLAADAEQDAWAIAEPAVATLRRAGAWARGSGLVPAAVEAALACGYRDAAERLVADAEDGLRDRDAPAATAELCLARGVLKHGTGDAAAAVRDFESARQWWSDIGRPYESAQACERLGVALSASSDGEAAGVRLTEALAGYDRLGAAHDAARCRHTLRDLGLVKPAGRGRRGYGDELSPRERQVAELVAGGATNHDIAEALFLSPRTVEQHVARMLRKLGTTRGGVGSALRSRERQRG